MTETPTILAVDDTSSTLTLLVELLTPEGYQVRTANSGELALETVAASQPDLILLDIHMNGMDGIEVCRRLKAGEATRHIPIILISAFAGVAEWVAGLQMGAADFIAKPFQKEEILSRVATHLALRRARLALEEEAVMLYQTATRLEAEIASRQRMEDELRRSLEQAERSRRALLSALEDQKLGENALRESEEKFSTVFQTAPYSIAIAGMKDGCLVEVNGAFTELSGFTREEALGYSSTELKLWLDEEHRERVIAAVRAGQTVVGEEFRLRTKSGEIRTGLFSARTINLAGESCLLASINDITMRKMAEEEIRSKTALLEAQANSTLDGILVVDPRGKKIFQNQRLVELWNIPRAVADDPDDARQVQHVMHSTRHPEQFVERITYLYSHPDETTRDEVELVNGTTLDRYSAPVVSRDGGNYGRIWTFRDITERKQAEANRRQLEAQLLQSQKMESIWRLAGGIAHDFNNCVNVIQGFAQLGLGRVREGDPLADDLGQVLKASERAATLTRQLLAFGRGQVLQPEVLNLNQVLAEMEKMLRRLIGEDIEQMRVLAHDLGLVKADPGQFGQVIMNLVINARDAMPEGGKLTIATANVELDADLADRYEGRAPGPYVMVAVTDTGVGMDSQTVARIFEPFFTTKAIGKGSGLGLSTAYGIVEQSGGIISVDSEVGRGTTFKVYLPRELSATLPAPTKPHPSPCQATGNETVLVVEDEEALRQLTVRLLEKAGYTVLAAADGEQALLACERHPDNIDLLLTDLVMPRMGGRLLAERLASLRRTLKILYMSGYTDDAIVHRGVLDMETQFLAKPFSEAELTRKVRTVLDGVLVTSGTDRPAVPDVVEARKQPLDREALGALPDAVRASLHEAAAAANYDEIVEIVETIASTRPDVATTLRRMVDCFDYEGIREFLC